MTVATQQELVERIWARDATLWTGTDEDQWLGWLDEPKRMQERAGEIAGFAEAARKKFETFVLLGMGGSSLAPEVLKRTFGAKQLHVLPSGAEQLLSAGLILAVPLCTQGRLIGVLGAVMDIYASATEPARTE